jgi:hypothetical protein
MYWKLLNKKSFCLVKILHDSFSKYTTLSLILLSLSFPSVFAQIDNPDISKLKSGIYDKLTPLIVDWQSSSDPEAFAHANNLTYSDGKILVYIYLESIDSIQTLPTDLVITSSADNIVSAFLDSRQITQISQLDSVIKIDLPATAIFPQERNPDVANSIKSDEDSLSNNNLDSYWYYILIVVAIAIAVYVTYAVRSK